MNAGHIVIRSASTVAMKVGQNGFEVTLQEGLLHKPNGEVVLVKFGVERGKEPYGVGEYDLSMDSLHTDKYGRLELRNLVLLPRTVAKSTPARAS